MICLSISLSLSLSRSLLSPGELVIHVCFLLACKPCLPFLWAESNNQLSLLESLIWPSFHFPSHKDGCLNYSRFVRRVSWLKSELGEEEEKKNQVVRSPNIHSAVLISGFIFMGGGFHLFVLSWSWQREEEMGSTKETGDCAVSRVIWGILLLTGENQGNCGPQIMPLAFWCSQQQKTRLAVSPSCHSRFLRLTTIQRQTRMQDAVPPFLVTLTVSK